MLSRINVLIYFGNPLKKGFATGTKKDWEHILHQTRKIEELAISQMVILKLQDEKTS